MTSPVPSRPAALRALLAFYADAGVDCVLDEAPVDRFAEAKAARGRTGDGDGASDAGAAAGRPSPAGGAPSRSAADRAQRAPANAGPSRGAPAREGDTVPPRAAPAGRPAGAEPPAGYAVPDEAALLDARAAAAEAGDLQALRAALEAFQGCNLRHSARSLVFADGNPQADVMFVGEAPGREEDIQGLPFVGRAGQLLDRMLAAIDLDRESAYITNMIPWRPPGNRTPIAHEIELCRPFIERHIELAAPKIVVFLGNVSTKALLGTTRGILSMRGTWSTFTVGGRPVPALPTLHPAYLLRNPAHKRLAWQDFLSLKARLAASEPPQ